MTEPASIPALRPDRQHTFLPYVLLLLATLPWWYAVRAQFIFLDDGLYVTENQAVLHGLTWPGIQEAFTTGRGAMWMPLTWLSFMLDTSLWGTGPAGYHATNVFLHIANTLLVYTLLRRATNCPNRSLAVALLWSLHPLRVESVAWATERKDVLSLFFGLISLCCYVQYTRRARRKVLAYILSLLSFAACLMAKPMLVTLPCVMLLLDVWPLKRFAKGALRGLAFEKLPFFVLSALISAITVILPARNDVLFHVSHMSLLARLGNGAQAYAYYLRDMIWFGGLAVLYVIQDLWVPLVALCALLVLAITCGTFVARRRNPALLIGWLWFLGTLLPVTGVMQIGLQSHADRFTYLPSIGLLVALIWCIPQRWLTTITGRRALAATLAIVLVVLTFFTVQRIALWRDPLALYRQGIARTGANPILKLAAGKELQMQQRHEEAIDYFGAATLDDPHLADAYNELGRSAIALGRLPLAVESFRRAADLDGKHFRENYLRALELWHSTHPSAATAATQPH